MLSYAKDIVTVKRIFLISLFLLNVNFAFPQSEQPCSGGSFEIVKPFLGTWEEYTIKDGTEVLIGKLESTIELNGCIISQKFVSEDSSFSYMSFGFVNPSSNIWEETYVFNNGSISRYQWLIENEDVLMRRTGGTAKLDYMHQLRLTHIRDDQYDVIEEHSFDGGKTWKNIELTRVKRTR